MSQFSLYVHKSGLKPHLFHFPSNNKNIHILDCYMFYFTLYNCIIEGVVAVARHNFKWQNFK